MSNRKALASVFAILVIGAVLALIVVAAQDKPDVTPPGISKDLWVPIADNAGIVLKPYNVPLIEGSTGYHGTLMIRSSRDGQWHKLLVDNPSPLMRSSTGR